MIAPAQEPDGYLNTVFGRPGQPPRYSDLEWGHELYNDGHLFQAAVARAAVERPRRVRRHRPAGRRSRVRRRSATAASSGSAVTRRSSSASSSSPARRGSSATSIRRRCSSSGAGGARSARSGSGRPTSRTTSRSATPPYSAATRYGRCTSPPATVDVAVETGDDELLARVIEQWEATIARRTYVTGGMGSQHTGEAFGDDFVLPADRAYSETCAGIGSVMLAWRLLLATGETRFADLIERTLYNVVATSPAPDGRHFFYANPLHQRVPGSVPSEDVESKRASSSLREPWFLVACCPTNVARTLASLAAYLATADDVRDLQIHQYADCRIATTLDDGRRVGVEVATRYPDDGTITVRVTETDGHPWALTPARPAVGDRRGARPTPTGRRPVGPGAVGRRAAVPGRRRGDADAPADAALDVAGPAHRRGPRLRRRRARAARAVRRVRRPAGRAPRRRVRVDPSQPPREVDGGVAVAGRLVSTRRTASGRTSTARAPTAAGERRRRSTRALQLVGQPRAVDDAGVAANHLIRVFRCIGVPHVRQVATWHSHDGKHSDRQRCAAAFCRRSRMAWPRPMVGGRTAMTSVQPSASASRSSA